MKKITLISAVVAVAAIAAIAMPRVANALVGNTNTAQCRLDAKTPVVYNETTKKFENLGKNFTYSTDGKTVTGTFVVSGTDPNCKKDVSFASWIMPKSFAEAGYQLKDQKLYDSATLRSVGRGTHTITVNLPQCKYWQIDMLEGTQATADDGSADYGWGAHMLDTTMGGKKCETPEKPEVCPYDPTMKKDDPNCVVKPPKTPETPDKELVYTKSSPVKEVPNTGAGSVLAGTLGASSTAGLAYSYLQSRRKLKALK